MTASLERVATIKKSCEPVVKPEVRKLSYRDERKDLQWHATAPGVVGLARVVIGLSGTNEKVFTSNVSSFFGPEHGHKVLRRAHEETANNLIARHNLSAGELGYTDHYASANELRSRGVADISRSYDVPARHVPIYLYVADVLTRNSTIRDDGRPAREFHVYINEDADPDFGPGDTINIFHQGAGQRSVPNVRWQQFSRLKDGAVVAFNHRYDEGYPVEDAYTRAYDTVNEVLQAPDFAEAAPLQTAKSYGPILDWHGYPEGGRS